MLFRSDKADQVSFTCENEMLHKETASFEANDDYIVLDYGLPVEIDPLVNDHYFISHFRKKAFILKKYKLINKHISC